AQRFLLDIRGGAGVKSSPYAYYRDNAEMIRAFGEGNLLKNTLAIAEMVTPYTLGSRQPRLAASPIERGREPRDVMRDLAWRGLATRLGCRADDFPFAYEMRMDYELRVIARMSEQLQAPFERYLLILADLAAFARKAGIRYGSRGSAAGSLVCWALAISQLDPVEHDLYFERFLNPDRVEMPDIDLDFADDRRDEVFAYIRDTYGVEQVAHIATFGQIGARQALRDGARLVRDHLAGPYLEVGDHLAGLIPHAANEITLDEVLADASSMLNQETIVSPDAAAVVDAARKIAGRFRGNGTHAAGVVIADAPLHQIAPLMRVSKPDESVIKQQVQYEMGWLEKIGLLKLDVLGLAELAKFEHAVNLIERQTGARPDLERLPMDDPHVWRTLHSGDTLGLFQLGGASMTRALQAIAPNDLSELAMLLAAYRPGAMANVDLIAARKAGREPMASIHPRLDAILEPTFGVPVYQEQLIDIFVQAAGMS
ncbi:MAG: DNA polymerase III subunit alpha, partial [Thermomicrobiales bacterium]